MQISFDPELHRYTLDGRHVPSVTQVLALLEDFSMVPQQLLEAARVFGQHVHEACHLFDQGELDLVSLDPALRPYVDGWANFVETEQVVVVGSELRVAHPKLRYAGTLDKRFIWRDQPWLGDIKSGVLPATVGPQTAAYLAAWKEMNPGAGQHRRCCIQLNPDFHHGYKIHRLADPGDMNDFLSALNCYRFKEKHHGRT